MKSNGGYRICPENELLNPPLSPLLYKGVMGYYLIVIESFCEPTAKSV
jgi:hypothetical protein